MQPPGEPTFQNALALFAVLASALASCTTRALDPVFPVLISSSMSTSTSSVVAPGEYLLSGDIDHASSPNDDYVQLWVHESLYAKGIALHPFFVGYDHKMNSWERWEVWADSQYGYYLIHDEHKRRYTDERETELVSSIHRQIGCVRGLQPITDIDKSGTDLLAEWYGSDARRLLEVLRQPETYPEHSNYLIWPGPNSNSYASWVLDKAKVAADLDPKMVGKDFRSPLGFGIGLTPTRTGVHFDLLTLGAAIGIQDGIEIHILGFTLGIDFWPLAIKSPLGRIGW